MSTVPLTLASFDGVVARQGVVLVEFWEPGCASCAAFGPVFDGASERHRELCFTRVDVEAEPALADSLGVAAVPTLMVFRDGVPLVREPGAMAAPDLEALITSVCSLDMDRIHQAIAELVAESKRATSHERQLH
jgi:thioredoxin 1